MIRVFLLSFFLVLPVSAFSATNQGSYPGYPWQGTSTAATYTGDVLQVYSTTNLMYDLVALNNNLYSLYTMLYPVVGNVYGYSTSIVNRIGYPDLSFKPTNFDNTNTVSGHLLSVRSDLTAVKSDTENIISLLGSNPQSASFDNYSSKLASIEGRISNMDPGIITQSMSFFAGILCAVSFVLAVKFMGGGH